MAHIPWHTWLCNTIQRSVQGLPSRLLTPVKSLWLQSIHVLAGDLSRNRTVGLRIGRGESLESIMGSMKAVAEGVLTSRSAHALAQKLGVECPIIEGIFRVIHEGADPVAVVTEVRPAVSLGAHGM